MGLGSGPSGNNGRGSSADDGGNPGGGNGAGGNGNESSGGRGRNGYGAGNRSQKQASDLAESQGDRRSGYARSAKAAFAGLTKSDKEKAARSNHSLTSRRTDYEAARKGRAAAPGYDGWENKSYRDAFVSRERVDELSQDFSSKLSNGPLGTFARAVGLAAPGVGLAVNAAIDAKQASDYAKSEFDVDQSIGDMLGTGVRSAAVGAVTGAAAGKVGAGVGGLLGKAFGPAAGIAGGITSAKATEDLITGAFTGSPNGYGVSSKVTKPADSGVRSLTDQSSAPVAPSNQQEEQAVTGYKSSFGNYDSHHQNFVYNANSAIQAWR